jgi:hypothetical protein
MSVVPQSSQRLDVPSPGSTAAPFRMSLIPICCCYNISFCTLTLHIFGADYHAPMDGFLLKGASFNKDMQETLL